MLYWFYFVSDSESWRPISGHRVNRYRTDPSLGPGHPTHSSLPKRLQDRVPSLGDCLAELRKHTIRDILVKLICLSYKPIELRNETDTETMREKSGTYKKLNSSSQVHVNYRLVSPKIDLPFGRQTPLDVAQKRSFNVSNPDRIVRDGPIFKSGTARQRRRRSARDARRRTKLKTTVVKVQQQLEDEEDSEWLPVPLAPPEADESSDTKTNIITEDLVQSFVSNTLPDLKQPQQSTGTLVQILSPLLSKQPSDSKWESAPHDGLVISYTPEPNQHKPTMWKKRPTVILVQDTPEEFLPKPPSHHSHESTRPESHFPPSSPQPFPRPTYHYPRPSPEPPPKPIYHYPSAEPSPEPEYQYISSTYKPASHPVHHYPVSEPHYPYTSVIIHTSTSIHPEPQPEPSPDPSWSAPLADYPESDLEDPQPGPEIIVGSDDSVSAPPPEPPLANDVTQQPSRPTPPPIFIFASPISPASSPGSPLNPVTISSGRPPPSIVILSSPEDVPAASPPLADPVAPAVAAGGAGGGGGLIPIFPIIPPIAPIVPVPVVPGLLGGSGGLGGGSGLAGGGNSNCPSVQVFNVQSISNSVENKDCIINLNSPVHNSIGDDQIEAPSDDIMYDDIPDSSTVATTTKKPSSGSMTMLEFLQDIISSMTFFNPITMSFWSFLFAPMSILLASGVGVAALVLPWVFPSYWFGRRSSSSKRRFNYENSPYKFNQATLRFERSVKSGMDFNDFLDNIGLL